MCISYFYDFLNDTGRLDRLLAWLGIPGKAVGAVFEKITCDGSNIDFTIELEGEGFVYFEIKYSEPEFGHAGKEKAKYEKIRAKYHDDAVIKFEKYRKHYQFVRNVCIAKDGNHTVFLIPKENENIEKSYEDVSKAVQNMTDFSVRRIFWEDLLDAFPNEDIRRKYFRFDYQNIYSCCDK